MVCRSNRDLCKKGLAEQRQRASSETFYSNDEAEILRKECSMVRSKVYNFLSIMSATIVKLRVKCGQKWQGENIGETLVAIAI